MCQSTSNIERSGFQTLRKPQMVDKAVQAPEPEPEEAGKCKTDMKFLNET